MNLKKQERYEEKGSQRDGDGQGRSVPMKYFFLNMWLNEFVYICRKKIMGVFRKTGFLQTNFFFLNTL